MQWARCGSMQRRADTQAGFSLLELLVALAIFGMAVVGLLNLSGESTRTAVILEERALAAVVAENQAIEALLAPAAVAAAPAAGAGISRCARLGLEAHGNTRRAGHAAHRHQRARGRAGAGTGQPAGRAEYGVMRLRRAAGFTLIELLVALAVFALVAAAAVGVLRQSIEQRAAV